MIEPIVRVLSTTDSGLELDPAFDTFRQHVCVAFPVHLAAVPHPVQHAHVHRHRIGRTNLLHERHTLRQPDRNAEADAQDTRPCC